ncbi:MAG: cation transporter [Oscillospiraceae bacterium]|nr:cation transporter [Oscillospiraceae bacterium]MBP3318989.1 cation transporter [Ruminiclostridium sp.]MBP3521749.1 cation transporter [Oscillospiraceae bacterium]
MKKKFSIEVDCANCAQKMEDAINKIEGVTATVSFMQQKLIVEAPDDRFEELMDQVVKTCKRVEPDCEIQR